MRFSVNLLTLAGPQLIVHLDHHIDHHLNYHSNSKSGEVQTFGVQ